MALVKLPRIKKFFLLSWKKLWIIVVGGFISILLHNFISGLFEIEEVFFFILVIFVIPTYTAVAMLVTLIDIIIEKLNKR